MSDLLYLQFDVPTFHIESIRSAHTDTLYATTSCKVNNPDGTLYHDFGSNTVPLGDHTGKQTVTLDLPMKIWIPAPIPNMSVTNPGVSVAWTFILTNSGHHGDVSALTKALNGGAGALAATALTGGAKALTSQAQPVGPSQTGDTSASGSGDGGGSSFTGPLIIAAVAAAIEGIATLITMLTADCDGIVAQQTYKWTANDLWHMVIPGKTWTQTKGMKGTDSPAGCGSNSEYDLTFRVLQIPAPPGTVPSPGPRPAPPVLK